MTEMDLEDETESVRILGIGVGLFLIILVCASIFAINIYSLMLAQDSVPAWL